MLIFVTTPECKSCDHLSSVIACLAIQSIED